jgi:hypothetical protein
MGPLFSALIIVPVALVVALISFLLVRPFFSARDSICVAISAPIGGAIGFLIAGTVLSFFYGQTLTSTAQVLTVLGTSSGVGIAAAVGAARLVLAFRKAP